MSCCLHPAGSGRWTCAPCPTRCVPCVVNRTPRPPAPPPNQCSGFGATIPPSPRDHPQETWPYARRDACACCCRWSYGRCPRWRRCPHGLRHGRPPCSQAIQRGRFGPSGLLGEEATQQLYMRSGDQVIRGNPASRGTEKSAEDLVGPPWRMESNAGPQQWYAGRARTLDGGPKDPPAR